MDIRIRSSGRPRGLTIGVIMMILLIVGVLVASIGLMNTQTLHDVAWSTYSEQASCAARAGLQQSVVRMKSLGSAWDFDGAHQATVSVQALPGRADLGYELALYDNRSGATVMLAPDGTLVPLGRIYVVSTGRFIPSGAARPAVTVGGLIQRVSLFRHALFVSDNLEVVSPSVTITGKVGTSNTAPSSIMLATLNNVTDTITLPATVTDFASVVDAKHATAEQIAAKVDLSTIGLPYPSISPPTNPIYTTPSGSDWLADRTYSGRVTVNGGTITMHKGSYYFQDDVVFKGNAQIVLAPDVTPSTPVKVYVGTTWDSGGCSIVDTDHQARRFQIYGTDSATSITIGGSASSDLLVYIKNGVLTLTGTGDMYGSFIGKTVRIVGTGDITFDPQAGETYLDPPAWEIASYTRR